MNLVKRVWTTVTSLENLLLKDALPPVTKKAMRECLSDVAWQNGQLAREILAACKKANWQETDEECRLISYLTFAGPPNTKFFLKHAFKPVERHIDPLRETPQNDQVAQPHR